MDYSCVPRPDTNGFDTVVCYLRINRSGTFPRQINCYADTLSIYERESQLRHRREISEKWRPAQLPALSDSPAGSTRIDCRLGRLGFSGYGLRSNWLLRNHIQGVARDRRLKRSIPGSRATRNDRLSGNSYSYRFEPASTIRHLES